MTRKESKRWGHRFSTAVPRLPEGAAQQRRAESNRLRGRRSRKQRCPRCQHLRIKWFDANWMGYPRRRWERRAEGLVCPLCIARETDPTVVGIRMGQLQHRK